MTAVLVTLVADVVETTVVAVIVIEVSVKASSNVTGKSGIVKLHVYPP